MMPLCQAGNQRRRSCGRSRRRTRALTQFPIFQEQTKRSDSLGLGGDRWCQQKRRSKNTCCCTSTTGSGARSEVWQLALPSTPKGLCRAICRGLAARLCEDKTGRVRTGDMTADSLQFCQGRLLSFGMACQQASGQRPAETVDYEGKLCLDGIQWTSTATGRLPGGSEHRVGPRAYSSLGEIGPNVGAIRHTHTHT